MGLPSLRLFIGFNEIMCFSRVKKHPPALRSGRIRAARAGPRRHRRQVPGPGGAGLPVSMTASSIEDVPRGMDFLFSLNRINVAVSRAKALALVVAAPRLLGARCATVEEVRLVNTLCALPVAPHSGASA